MLPDGHLRAVLARYQGEPAAVRAHNLARALSCPFAPVEAQVPGEGMIVDLGCGRGLFAGYLARCGPRRRVHGIEPDADRVTVARRCLGADRLTFAVGDARATLPGGLAAVTLVDVLYLLPAAEQETALRQAAAALGPGGRLLVKELDPEAGLRAHLARWQEHLAVHAFGWTRGGAQFHFRSPATWATTLAALGMRTFVHWLDRTAVHPHVLVVGIKPGSLAAAPSAGAGQPARRGPTPTP